MSGSGGSAAASSGLLSPTSLFALFLLVVSAASDGTSSFVASLRRLFPLAVCAVDVEASSDSRDLATWTGCLGF